MEDNIMYIKPQEYLIEIKLKIGQLKKELAELESVYEAMTKAGISENASQAKALTNGNHSVSNSSMTHAEKIAEAQRKRHKKARDEKVPIIEEYILKNGPASLTKLSVQTKTTMESLKQIFAENPDKFRQNPNNNLWELK